MNQITNSLVLIGAMMIAVQIRLNWPVDAQPAATTSAETFTVFVILVASAFLSTLLKGLYKTPLSARHNNHQFLDLLVALVLSVVGILLLLPNVDQGQVVAYAIVTLGLGFATMVWPQKFSKAYPSNLRHNLAVLWDNRYLLKLWTQNTVQARYAQAVLGVLWIVLLPLAQALIMSLVFSRFVRMDVGDVPFISFFLAALAPWNFFSQSLMNSTGVMTSMMSLIGQIYFPREILVLVRIGEALVDFLFMFLAVVFVNALVGVAPSIYFLYLPLLIFISVALALGIGFFLSYLSVRLRDIPQLLFVMLQLLFYATPILYPLSFVPSEFRFLLFINPMVPLIDVYRDVLAYRRAPDLVSLSYPLVIGLVLLYLGYQYLKANERSLADYV